ncbi:histidinol dehydrogenase [Algisphaera agarilytica]|uniref:Histidinol dehydrogenase n=1 Tax=Algisphaera agarilytica TaxID=1385975 RepID=A0A7X0LLZ6_9BACT|nr:histidinol dehydrogenase [Algisphaera agarilytica]MBB6430488.1 histidinol dehydrogenase [Algisphaera agarilytica]
MLPIYDLQTPDGQAGLDACLARLRDTASATGDAAKTVADVMADVQAHGDAALVKYMQKWTDPAFDAARIRVTAEELAEAEATLAENAELRDAIQRAIDNVREYQQHVMPADTGTVTINGAELGMRWTAVDKVGLCVPGGTAVLFSTLVMLAVPAMVAGVAPENIHVMSPPPTAGTGMGTNDISPIVLGTCKMLGITNVYRIGGAQGVAALGHGTESVPQVDLIAGPGNIFVQLAKAQLGAACGTDNGFYGPSEIVTVADASANPRCVGADLIAQAEHNPGKCFLVAWEAGVIDAIVDEVETQLWERDRTEAIVNALRDESCAVVANDEAHAIEIANTFAAEHVNLAVADPQKMLDQIRHAGEVFLGDQTPVAAGDYHAGPSHCLPTGTTARFTSGVSVYTFLKRTGTVAYPSGMSSQTIADIAAMAEAEGLDGHAASARVRG